MQVLEASGAAPRTRTADPLRLTNPPPTVVNCQNGELWFDANANSTFKPHRPESFLRNCLNVDYVPGATSPMFDKAVLEIFAKTKNPEAHFDHFMEFVGYSYQAVRETKWPGNALLPQYNASFLPHALEV